MGEDGDEHLIPVSDLFESHLNVADLQRSMNFFGQTLGLELILSRPSAVTTKKVPSHSHSEFIDNQTLREIRLA